jgi:hypothetical protein
VDAGVLRDKAALLGVDIKGTYVFEPFTGTENSINFLDHQLIQLEMDGAQIGLLFDPLTVQLCVRLFV